MRSQLAGATIAFLMFIGSSPSGTVRAGTLYAPPVFNLWYGNDQRFSALGTTQRWANILGSVDHPTGINSLKYSLNGGALRNLSFMPDDRRIHLTGDFNIDLRFTELLPGDNTVLIKAVANSGDSAQTTVMVRNLGGAVWPLPYSCAWSQLGDSAQVVDGKWSLMGGGVQVMEPGYDRLITLGDTTWTDYEVTAKLTVQGIDSTQSAWDSNNGGPGIGFLMRWKGHTNVPVLPITQPLSGYIPFGAIGWFHWGTGWGQTAGNRWEICAPVSGDLAVRTSNNTVPLYYGTAYYIKMQVKTISGTGPLYKFKVWRVGSTEPTTWLMQWQEPTTALGSGSIGLLAHHVVATFGVVNITPVPDGIPPVIANIVATPAPTTATITWTTDEPATSIVSYGLTSSYGNVASDLLNLVTSHTIQLQGLTPNTAYHFAVSSADWGGASSTSPDRMFNTTTLTPPTPPVLVAPGNGSSNNPVSLTMRWNSSVTATGYRLQLGTDATFATGIIVHDSTLTDTLRAVSGLPPGTRLYWRVLARNDAGEGSFSSVSTFTTALDVPVLASPANGALNVSPTPWLCWHRVTSASSYRVRVSTDSTLTGIAVFDDSTVVDTFRVASGMQVGQKYYWRVRAKNAEGIGGWSYAWSFTAGVASPAMLSPANGSSNQSVNSILRWSSVPAATLYDVQLGTNPTFASGVVIADSMLPDTSRAMNGLLPGTLYYWRVRARNASGPGEYSLPWSFSTGLSVTQLLAPANGSSGQPLSLRFLWQQVANASAYSFQLGTDSTFASGLIKDDPSVVDTSRFIAGLLYKTTYFWHVRARQDTLSGPWSETWNFTTSIRFPDPVVLIQLTDGANVAPDSARFIWTKSQPGVNRYWFEMALDSNFMLTNVDSSLVDSTTVRYSFINNASYYWRVRAGNLDGWGPFSPPRRFYVGPMAVRTDQGLPTTYALEQNYPNPFNPSTRIRFAIPSEGRVRIEIYSVLGERIATVVDDQFSPGIYTVDVDGSRMASGVYYYRLVTTKTSITKKMLLVK
jgi:hypothetical protein